MSTQNGGHAGGDRYHGRVTVDLDGYTGRFRFKAIRAYHQLQRDADAVDVHISSSGEGLHLVGWFKDQLTFSERIDYRRQLGDDPKRVQIDIERARNGVYTGVLWSRKSSNPGGVKDRDFADIYDALDHMDATNRSDADRMRSLANGGHKAEPSLAHASHGGDDR
jgi:hypothetical protein